MHGMLLIATKVAFATITFIAFLIKDEVTTIDNTQWLSIQLYVLQACKRIPTLFVLR
jgi:hypothetical protein